jgi:hypothetical protein
MQSRKVPQAWAEDGGSVEITRKGGAAPKPGGGVLSKSATLQRVASAPGALNKHDGDYSQSMSGTAYRERGFDARCCGRCPLPDAL